MAIKRLLLTLPALLVMQLCSGQSKHISGSSFMDYELREFKWAGFSNLVTSTDSLHFRFTTAIQAVEIWTNDYKTFHGLLINYTTDIDDHSDNTIAGLYDTVTPTKYFTGKAELDTATAGKVYALFKQSGIFDVPTNDSIPGWGMGHDGESFFIERSTPTQYSFKNYWSPWSFRDKFKQAAVLDELIDELKTTLHLKEVFRKFVFTLPPGCYVAGGMQMLCNEKGK